MLRSAKPHAESCVGALDSDTYRVTGSARYSEDVSCAEKASEHTSLSKAVLPTDEAPNKTVKLGVPANARSIARISLCRPKKPAVRRSAQRMNEHQGGQDARSGEKVCFGGICCLSLLSLRS